MTLEGLSSETESWTTTDSARIYGLNDWGSGYFDVSDHGTLRVLPDKDPSRALDLLEIVNGLVARGLRPPIVLRFPDLLRHRMNHIALAFKDAIEELGYEAVYSCVYPIKVNQQRHVCECVCEAASGLGFGLEVGSKPELLAGLALTVGRNGMPLVCNGFKDPEFIETVVLAAKMRRNVIPVVEQFRELELLVRYAQEHGVSPRIGIRARLATGGVGRWASSSGYRGKFGLSVSEILTAVTYLREQGMLDSLRMLHCHIGSQVHDIRTVKYAVSEVTYLYTELAALGAPMGMLDIGGGLGVDYDGTQSASDSSVNYTVEQYALDVVHRVQSICDGAGIAHPMLLSESGRALVAHSSAIVCEAVGSRSFPERPDPAVVERAMASDEVPQPLLDMADAYNSRDEVDPIELFNDAAHALDEAMSLFNLGYMSIAERAATEELYWSIGKHTLDRAGLELPEELEALPALLGDLYFINLSVFQSLLDSWGIEQVFPILPIHRLDECPTRRGSLADMTCDSDGRIDRFASAEGPKATLELHSLVQEGPDESGNSVQVPYYLGIFLTGAYQETLGDLHNLFGDTHAVHVALGPDGGWRIEDVVEGDTVGEVLTFVQYDPVAMREELRKDTEAALAAGWLTLAEAVSLRRFLDEGLHGYTYLE